ncbi:MAG TPA: beta-propeller fold lactonase family protein [Terriglobales bacterium]|nr:beta-propeller fold lactonase family protein [Terriglobales bacterium]
MLMRVSWLASVAIAVFFLMSCGKNSKFPTSNTMYVATQSAAQVWGYRANFNNGRLSTINGSPFAAAPASALLIDPSKSFAYLAVAGGQIQRFSFDLNGSLVPMSGNPVPTGINPVAMAMDSGGKFLFVANQGTGVAGSNSSSISVFSVGSGASLTSVQDLPVGFPLNFPVANPNPAVVALAVNSALNLLYVVDQNDGYVLTFPYNSTTGMLPSDSIGTRTVASEATLVGTAPSAVAMSPAGSFLYVANAGSNNVSGFNINSHGSLTAMDKSPFAAELGPSSAAVDSSGQFLYVADQGSNQISGYRITATTGDLTPTIGSPYNTGAGPIFVAISPINRFLYVSNNSAATISGFSIDPAGGNLAAVSSTVTTGTQPTGIAFGK